MATSTENFLFHPGQVVMTPGAMHAMKRADQMPGEFLARHAAGDWGRLDASDRKANDRAMKTGLRLLSSYETRKGDTLWIITEAIDIEAGGDPRRRATTTILLPDEY